MEKQGLDRGFKPVSQGDFGMSDVRIQYPYRGKRKQAGGQSVGNKDWLVFLGIIYCLFFGMKSFEILHYHFPAKNDKVVLHYVGMLANKDRTVFDSSRERTDPVNFILGEGKLLQGLEEQIYNIPVGKVVTVEVPAEKAFGKDGYKGIVPPNQDLLFEIEILSSEPQKKKEAL
jgi:FK506-binding protein 1